MLINPHFDDDLMVDSFEVCCEGVVAKVVLREPLVPQTDISRANSRLLKGAFVEAVYQTLLNCKRSRGLPRHGYRPYKGQGDDLQPGQGDTFIKGAAQEAFDEHGVQGLADFCAEQAHEITTNCRKPELAAA